MAEDPGAGGSLVGGFGRFSLSPQAQKIIEIARDERAPAQSFVQVISADPILAPRLIRLANLTPGLSGRLATFPQATSVFGQDHLKALALALTVFAPNEREGDSEAALGEETRFLRSLWEHALGCAILAGQIAARLKNPAPLHAFTAGFVHDVGRALLYRHDREKFRKAVRVAAEKCIPLRQAETLAIGINHTEMGEIWCRNTDLAPVLQKIALKHHEDLAPGLETIGGEELQLMAVVQAADSMCEACGMGSGTDLAGAPLNAWRGLKLDENEWLDSLHAIKTQIVAAAEDFGFPASTTSEPLQRIPLLERSSDGIARPQREVANGPRGRVIPFPVRPGAVGSGEDKPTAKKLVILVVEDHNSLCDMLSLYLMRHGYHVRAASSGEIALDILAKEEIHLILLDLMLPRLDGFAVLRQVRQSHKGRVPYIIVVSAGASEKDRSKVLDMGANEYMPKPFHLLRLLERIQNVEKYIL